MWDFREINTSYVTRWSRTLFLREALKGPNANDGPITKLVWVPPDSCYPEFLKKKACLLVCLRPVGCNLGGFGRIGGSGAQDFCGLAAFGRDLTEFFDALSMGSLPPEEDSVRKVSIRRAGIPD